MLRNTIKFASIFRVPLKSAIRPLPQLNRIHPLIMHRHFSSKMTGLFKPDSAHHKHFENKIYDAYYTYSREDKSNYENLLVTWLRKYCPELVKRYKHDKDSLHLVAEATYWSFQMGLEPLIAKMSYEEIREFQPLAERYLLKTSRTTYIDIVCDQLIIPAFNSEASYALCQAALCIYTHHNSYEKLKENEKKYKPAKSDRDEIRQPPMPRHCGR